MKAAEAIKAARHAFEFDWNDPRRSGPPDVAGHLPPVNDPARLPVLAALLLLDQDFRSRRGGALPASFLLGRFPELGLHHPEGAAALLLDEYDRLAIGALRRGEHPIGPHDFLAGHVPEPLRPRVAATLMPSPDASGLVVLEKLGSGGMGEVSLAFDRRLGRFVALKRVLHGSEDPEKLERALVAERAVTARLDHPGVVPVHQGFDDGGRPGYTMRRIETPAPAGSDEDLGPFHDVITTFHGREGGPDFVGQRFRRMVGRLVAVCDVIAYAHKRGVLHLDLKPGNVFVGPFGETLVVDWGLADAAAPSHSAGGGAGPSIAGIDGSPAYMSPERARGDRLQESDVYSLGAMLSTMLTGAAPFAGLPAGEVFRRVAQGERPAPPRAVQPRAPRPLEAVCLKAMDPDPGRRYGSARELRNELQRWLDADRVRADCEPWSEAVRRFARRHRTGVSVAAALALVTAAATGVLMAREWSAEARRLTERLVREEPTQVPAVLASLHPYRRWSRDALRDAAAGPLRPWRAALARPGWPAHEPLLRGLTDPDLPVAEVALVGGLLKGDPRAPALGDLLVGVLGDGQAGPARRLRAAAALAQLDRDAIARRGVDFTELARWLSDPPPPEMEAWAEALRPIDDRLRPALQAAAGSAQTARAARRCLAALAAGDAARLAPLWLDADVDEAATYWPALRAAGPDAIAAFHSLLAADRAADLALPTATPATERDRDGRAHRRATSVAALARLGDLDALRSALRRAPDPRERSALIAAARPIGIDLATLSDALKSEQSDPGVRQALLMAIGEWPLTVGGTDYPAFDDVVALFKNDPDPGVHSAAGWLLRRWAHSRPELAVRVLQADSELEAVQFGAREGRSWFCGANRHHMAFVPHPSTGSFKEGDTNGLWIGTKPDAEVKGAGPGPDSHRLDRDERAWDAPLPVPFAVSTAETTREQLERFCQAHGRKFEFDPGYFPDPDCPAGSITAHLAMQYCNWLTRLEFGDKADEELCYDEKNALYMGPGAWPFDGFQGRRGYRLPTEAEWEYVSRAGATTSRHYGHDPGLLPRYAAFLHNSPERTQRVGTFLPNDFGVFDSLGNVFEWCHFTPGTWQSGQPETLWAQMPVRGSSYFGRPEVVRSNYRISQHWGEVFNNIYGFRVVRSLPELRSKSQQ